MSLIEVVVFILVLGIAIAGAVVLFGKLTESSVDPVVRKQTLAIAASLLEEIELQPFTYCDPDEPAVYTATAATAAQCGGDATHVEVIGKETFSPPGTEDRYDQTTRFDNVNDYDGFNMGGATMRSVDGTVLTGLADYSVSVTVTSAYADFGFPAPTPPDIGPVLRIKVIATHTPSGLSVTLEGYRFRYAPNSP